MEDGVPLKQDFLKFFFFQFSHPIIIPPLLHTQTWLLPWMWDRQLIITSRVCKLGASTLTRHLTGSTARKFLYCEMHIFTSVLKWTVCYKHKPYCATITNSTGQSPFWEIDTQLVTKSVTYYELRRFTSMLTRVCYWILFCTKIIQYIPAHPNPLKFILILSPSMPRSSKEFHPFNFSN